MAQETSEGKSGLAIPARNNSYGSRCARWQAGQLSVSAVVTRCGSQIISGLSANLTLRGLRQSCRHPPRIIGKSSRNFIANGR